MFCKYYRWKLAQSLHSDKPLPKLLARHLQRCDECRSFYEQQQEMSERLGRDAVVSQSELPEALKQEIMNAIVPGNPVPSTYVYSPEAQRLWRWVLAAASIGLVFLGGLHYWLGLQHKSETPEKYPTTEVKINPSEAGQWLVNELGAKQVVANWPGIVEGPMIQELETLTAEAESAVRFIVTCVDVDFGEAKGESG